MPSKVGSKIGITLYTVRDFFKDDAQTVESFQRLRKIGYQNIEISVGRLMEIDPKELYRMASDAGLKIIGCHIGDKMIRENFDRFSAMLKAWKCGFATIPWLAPDVWGAPNAWQNLAKDFTVLGKKCAKEGIKLQYHNHQFEFNRFGVKNGKGGKLGYEIFWANSDKRFLGAEMDLGWVARTGSDPAVWIKRLAGRLDQVHMKDWGIVNTDQVWMPVGEGNMNWKAILAACKAAKVKYYIVEQDTCTTAPTPFDGVEISFKNLRKLGMK